MNMPNQSAQYCNVCQQTTNFREVVGNGVDVQPFNAPEMPAAHRLIYSFKQCGRCGLDFLFFMDYLGQEHIYPPRGAEHGQPFTHLPPALHTIYRETHQALHSQNLLLCAMGIRTLVEGVCSAKGITQGEVMRRSQLQTSSNLDGKIAGMLAAGLVTQAQREALDSFRFMGNAATHQMLAPEPDELALAIQILESILRSTFELPARTAELQTRRTGRQG